MRRLAAFALLTLLSAATALGYVVKLKDGSLLFARIKYEVKGTKAIITLENGTVTQIDLDKVDVPGTEEYNKKYSGNVIAIDTPEQKAPGTAPGAPTPAMRLQDLVKQKLRGSAVGSAPSGGGTSEAGSWQPVDSLVLAAFSKVFDGASIPQWRVSSYRGQTRLVATANSEEAVFNILSAAARALRDLSDRGKDTTIGILLTTATNEPAGSFEMTPDQARQLVNGTIAVGDYFVKNVIL